MEESGHVDPALLGPPGPPKDIADEETVLSSVLVSVAGEGVTRAVAFVITSDTSPTEALLHPIIETSYFLPALATFPRCTTISGLMHT